MEYQIQPPTALFLVIVVLTGCAHTKAHTKSESLRHPVAGTRVLLLPSHIELYELSAGGLAEPKAEWTAQAQAHVTAALKEEISARKAHLILYQPPKNNPAKEHAHIQLVKLYDAVWGAILTHQYGWGPSLPTKEGKFDWSLGQGTKSLREDYAADYGLFVFLRDSYASAGRIAAAAVMSALNLFYVHPGGRQVGFSSLIDLLTGDIVWFNWLENGMGDLRTTEPARKTVQELLTDFPL